MWTLDDSKTEKPTQISLFPIKLLPFLFYSDYRASYHPCNFRILPECCASETWHVFLDSLISSVLLFQKRVFHIFSTGEHKNCPIWLKPLWPGKKSPDHWGWSPFQPLEWVRVTFNVFTISKKGHVSQKQQSRIDRGFRAMLMGFAPRW